MAELVLGIVLRCNSCSVSSTDDDGGTLLLGLDGCVEQRLGTTRKRGEFKHTGGSARKGCSFAHQGTLCRTHPFQRIVLADKTVSQKSSRLFGPASRPIQPSGIPSWMVALPVYPKGISDAGTTQGVSDLGVLVKLVGGDEIDGENELDVVGLCFFDESSDFF